MNSDTEVAPIEVLEGGIYQVRIEQDRVCVVRERPVTLAINFISMAAFDKEPQLPGQPCILNLGVERCSLSRHPIEPKAMAVGGHDAMSCCSFVRRHGSP